MDDRQKDEQMRCVTRIDEVRVRAHFAEIVRERWRKR